MAYDAVPCWPHVDVRQVLRRCKAIAFDLDNTLARSKNPMNAAMASEFSRLTRHLPVAVITGGGYQLVRRQVLDVLTADADLTNLHVMPTSGTCY